MKDIFEKMYKEEVKSVNAEIQTLKNMDAQSDEVVPEVREQNKKMHSEKIARLQKQLSEKRAELDAWEMKA